MLQDLALPVLQDDAIVRRPELSQHVQLLVVELHFLLRIKMRQIFVDARDKTSGAPARLSFTLPQTLVFGSGHQGCVDVLRLPILIPTAYAGNNTINLTTQNGTPCQATVLNGQRYTGQALADAVKSAINAAAPGRWNATYDAANMNLGIADDDYAFVFTGSSWVQKYFDRDHARCEDAKEYGLKFVSLQGTDMVYF